MAMRKISALKIGNRCRVTVKVDREWGEYQVKAWRGRKVTGTYHTPDRDDATGTQKAMGRELLQHHSVFCRG